jgi:pimeloyl-ACP methyl ester carboxylesterase
MAIRSVVLVGYDWGGRGLRVAALWPERVSALVAITGYGIQDIAGIARPAVAEQEYRYWYQWYFHTTVEVRTGGNRGELTFAVAAVVTEYGVQWLHCRPPQAVSTIRFR